MRKFIFMFILSVIFIAPIKVNANEAKCVYDVALDTTLTITATDDSFDVKFKTSLSRVSSSGNDIARTDILNDSKLFECPSQVYYAIAGTSSADYSFSFTSSKTFNLKAKLDAENSYVKNENNPDKKYTHTCSYDVNTLYYNDSDVKFEMPKFKNVYLQFKAADLGETCPERICLLCNTREVSLCNVFLSSNYQESGVECISLNVIKPPVEEEKEEEDKGHVIKPVTCDTFKDIIDPIWFLIRVAAPIIVLVLGAVDFMKMTAAGDEKDIKKLLSVFIKRLIILAAILILPTIVNLIIGITGFNDLSACL